MIALNSITLSPNCVQQWLRASACAMICAGLAGTGMAADKGAQPAGKNDAPSGIMTQVQSEPGRGEPSTEEQGHITVLGAQILHQVARARDAIDSADRDAAAQAIGKARQALKLVRQMLPSSVVSTTVMDSAGNVLYEDVEDVRQGSVTVSRSFTAINVVSPIVESKQSAAETAGAEFEGKAMIEADVVVNLDFVDRRLAEANRVLATDPERADQSLFQAQTQGTNLIFVDIESPLDECREALRYAHRSAEAKQYRAAEANLRIARGYLMLYREMAPEDAKDEIDKLNKDIDVTAQQIASTTPAEHEKASSRLKEFREKIENWWRKPKRSETKPAADAASKVLPKE